jgi:putative SOS response-associated peptidase YedK
MCGRARLSSDVSEIKLVFSIPPQRPTPNIAPSWNVAPTDPLPIVRHDGKAGERSLDVMRWGLVPFWAKDIKIGFANINAKAEGIDSKPAFREAFQRRLCLVPIDDFFEWAKTTAGKVAEMTFPGNDYRRGTFGADVSHAPAFVNAGSRLLALSGVPRRRYICGSAVDPAERTSNIPAEYVWNNPSLEGVHDELLSWDAEGKSRLRQDR